MCRTEKTVTQITREDIQIVHKQLFTLNSLSWRFIEYCKGPSNMDDKAHGSGAWELKQHREWYLKAMRKHECQWVTSHSPSILINHESNELPKFISQSDICMSSAAAGKKHYLLSLCTRMSMLVISTFLKELSRLRKVHSAVIQKSSLIWVPKNIKMKLRLSCHGSLTYLISFKKNYYLEVWKDHTTFPLCPFYHNLGR